MKNKNIIEKKLKETKDYIDSFNLSTCSLLTIESLNIKSTLSSFTFLDNKVSFFSKKGENFDKQKNYSSIITINSNDYLCDNTLYMGSDFDYDKNQHNYTFSFNILKNISFPEKGYFRYVSVSSEDQNPFPLLQCRNLEVKQKNVGFSGFIVTTEINKKHYHIFSHSIIEDKSCLFIDCMEEEQIDTFYNNCYSILVLLGFIKSKISQDYCYIIANKDNTFSSPISLTYNPNSFNYKLNENIIFAHAHDILNKNNLSKKEKQWHSFISEEVFKNMINHCFNSIEFLNSIILILLSNEYSLEAKPVCLSVALEGLSGYLTKLNNLKTSELITDKKEKDKFIQTLIDSIPENLNDDSKRIISNRIKSNLLGTPNDSKLELPFPYYHIELREYEKNAIFNRNAFLHSHIHFDLWDKSVLSNQDFKKYYFESLVLEELLMKLIYKASSYSGYYYNFVKKQENFIFGLIAPTYLGELIEEL